MTMLCKLSVAVVVAAGLMLATPSARAADDIIATADKAGSFKTLIAAIKAAGLSETLTGKGPFTVFAPTDEAFKKLPAGTLDNLLKPESKATLASILKYHVLPGKYSAERLQKAKTRQFTVKTAEGVPVLFDKRGGLAIAGARIGKTDIGASNGTIHIIDTVILPPAVKKAMAASSVAAAAKSAAPAAKTEAPKAPAAKADAPKPDAAKADAPKATEPARGGQPVAPAAGKAEAPKADAAKGAIPAVPAGPKK